MGPQPLSKVRRKAFAQFNTEYLVSKPYQAAMIMGVISLAAQIDNKWAYILADMHGTERRSAVAMYHALTGGEGRRSALTAAAEEKLSPQKLALFQAVFKISNPTRKRRNDFAHHLWGGCDELPDDLLLIDPKDDNAFRLWLDDELDRIKKTGKRRPFRFHDPSTVQVWTPKALLQELNDALNSVRLVSCLVIALKQGPRGRMRQILLSDPQVQQALDIQARKTNQATQRPRRSRTPRGKSRL